jgi:hypothetical protein
MSIQNKLSLLVFLFLINSVNLSAQWIADQVVVSNGGSFGEPGNLVKFGSYKIATNSFSMMDSVMGNFTRVAYIEDSIAYFSAEDIVFAYNLNNHVKVINKYIEGITGLATTATKFIAGKGFGSQGTNYVQLFGRPSFSNIANLNLPYPVEDVIVVGDTAYLSHILQTSMLRDSLGFLSVINMSNNTVVRTMPLGESGAGIGKLLTDGVHIYSAASGSNRILKYNIQTANASFLNPGTTNVNNAIALHGDTLYANFDLDGFGSYNVRTETLINAKIFGGYFITGTKDTVNNEFYVTETDYFSYGTMYRIDRNGNFLDTIQVGVSPEAIAVYYRPDPSAGLKKKDFVSSNIGVYPNPAKNLLTIVMENKNAEIIISDVTGKVVYKAIAIESENTINVENFTTGIYLITVETEQGRSFTKFVKN